MGPTQDEITQALLFFECRVNGAQVKEIEYFKGVILAAIANGTITLGVDATITSSGGRVLARTISKETDSTHSPIIAGSKSNALIFSSDFAGTIGGVDVDPNQMPSYSESVINQADTLPALAYTVTAGSLIKITLS